MYFLGSVAPRTQKARGISRLQPDVTRVFAAQSAPALGMTAQRAKDIDFGFLLSAMHSTLGMAHNTLLIRPCPMRPRHGFVDSTVYAGAWDEKMHDTIRSLAERVLAEDPEGELIIASYIGAQVNFVATPANITLGDRHDGATAGRNTITLPIANPYLLGERTRTIGSGLRSDRFGIGQGEWPYVEGVSRDGSGVYVTQVRAGPAVPVTMNFVPQPTLVREVVPVDSDDLLAWEKRMAELRGSEGMVVYHPGGSLTSHFGVHAVLNGIPYVTTHEPYVGDTLEAEGQRAWSKDSYRELAHLLARILHDRPRSMSSSSTGISQFRQLCEFGFATLHASAYLLQNDTPASRLTLAHGIAAAARSFLSLAYGEARHVSVSGRGKAHREVLEALDWNDATSRFISSHRESVYVKAYMHRVSDMARWADWSVAAFEPALWRNGSGYGGTRWQECATAAADFFWAAMDFIRDQGVESFDEMMKVFNRLITLAHNGGWWLNKVMTQDRGNQLSELPQAGMVMPIVYHTLRSDVAEATQQMWDTYASTTRTGTYLDRVEAALRQVQNRRYVTPNTRWAIVNGNAMPDERGAGMAMDLKDMRLPLRISLPLDLAAIFDHPDHGKRIARPFTSKEHRKLLYALLASRQGARVNGVGTADALDAMLVCGRFPGLAIRLRNGYIPEKLERYIHGSSQFVATIDGKPYFLFSFVPASMSLSLYWLLALAGISHRWVEYAIGLPPKVTVLDRVTSDSAAISNHHLFIHPNGENAVAMLRTVVEEGAYSYPPLWAHALCVPGAQPAHVDDDEDYDSDEEASEPEPEPETGNDSVSWSPPPGIQVRSTLGSEAAEAVAAPPRVPALKVVPKPAKTPTSPPPSKASTSTFSSVLTAHLADLVNATEE